MEKDFYNFRSSQFSNLEVKQFSPKLFPNQIQLLESTINIVLSIPEMKLLQETFE